MKKFIGYFENKITFELDNYSNHIENDKELIVKDMKGQKFIFIKLDMKKIYGDEMPIDIIYKCGRFIKFDRYEIK